MLTCDSAATSLCLAPALSTSKEQCKNGGWRNFGSAFKSQGQCVAFVQRGPQHQCKHGGYAQFGFKNQGQCVAIVQRGPKPKTTVDVDANRPSAVDVGRVDQ